VRQTLKVPLCGAVTRYSKVHDPLCTLVAGQSARARSSSLNSSLFAGERGQGEGRQTEQGRDGGRAAGTSGHAELLGGRFFCGAEPGGGPWETRGGGPKLAPRKREIACRRRVEEILMVPLRRD
jgi:hypothetical protein